MSTTTGSMAWCSHRRLLDADRRGRARFFPSCATALLDMRHGRSRASAPPICRQRRQRPLPTLTRKSSAFLGEERPCRPGSPAPSSRAPKAPFATHKSSCAGLDREKVSPRRRRTRSIRPHGVFPGLRTYVNDELGGTGPGPCLPPNGALSPAGGWFGWSASIRSRPHRQTLLPGPAGNGSRARGTCRTDWWPERQSSFHDDTGKQPLDGRASRMHGQPACALGQAQGGRTRPTAPAGKADTDILPVPISRARGR